MSDRITFLRTKYAKDINVKETELQNLRGKLALLDELEADSSDYPSEIETQKVNPNGSHENPPTSKGGATGRTGLTQTALNVVRKIAIDGRWTSAPEVRDQLLADGFSSVTKNFSIQVGTTLKRLQKQGLLKSRSHNGSRQYALVTEHDF